MFNQTRRNTTTATDAGRKVHRRPSAALVVSSLALFTALSGGAYAASTIGSPQIKNNSVQGIDVKDGTIKSADIAAGTRNGLKGQQRSGRRERRPAQGRQGRQGRSRHSGRSGRAPGLSGLQRVTVNTPSNSASGKTLTINCPAGKSVVGTGFDISGATTGAEPNLYKEATIDEVAIAPDLELGDVLRLRAEGRHRLGLVARRTVICATVA